MNFDAFKSEHWLSYRWHFQTIDRQVFFAPIESLPEKFSGPDFPLRFFLARINRDLWSDFDRWRISDVKILSTASALREMTETISQEFRDGDGDDDEFLPHWSLRHDAVLELASFDEVVSSIYVDDGLQRLNDLLGTPLSWDALGSLMALLHIADGVRHLESKDLGMAGAYAISAQMWQSEGRYQSGRLSSEQIQKRQLAASGADALHRENRRVRKQAIETYVSKTWPSKMQAARVIAQEVHRTELVVMRWIREHHKGSSRDDITLPAE